MVDIASVSAALDGMTRWIAAIGNLRRNQRRELSRHLGTIVSLLEAVMVSIKANKIPYTESHGLAMTINFAEDCLHGIFKIDHLDQMFSVTLPRIGRLMEKADIYIEENYQKGNTHRYIVRHPEAEVETIANSNPIPELEKELQRALGALRAAQAALAADISTAAKGTD